MAKGTFISTGVVLAIVVLAISAVGIGFAYQAITENSGNYANVSEKTLLIYNDQGDQLECMELPAVSYTGSYNDWDVAYYSPHVSGKMVVTDTGTGDCHLRVWVQMQDVRSWAAVDKISVRILGTDYALFNESSDNRATDQTNAELITIPNNQKNTFIDVDINVQYKENLNYNPYAAGGSNANFMKSKVIFLLDDGDPINANLKVTFKNYTGRTPQNYAEVYNDLFYGELLKFRPADPAPPITIDPAHASEYRTVWTYKVNRSESNIQVWDFSSNRLTSTDFALWEQEGVNNMNLYPRFDCQVTFVYVDDISVEHRDVEWNPYDTAISKTDPTSATRDFDGWYDAAVGGNKITNITGPITLYAHWTSKT